MQQQPLDTMADEFEVPEAIQAAADKYAAATKKKAKAVKDFNTAQAACIDAMKEEGVDRVRVMLDGGNEKILTLEEKDQLKFRKPKKQENAEETEE